jgi:hypothetical protein
VKLGFFCFMTPLISLIGPFLSEQAVRAYQFREFLG